MTTFKLYSAATTDGAVYIDLPVSGKISHVQFVGRVLGGAGGAGSVCVELSRVAVNQVAVSNPRGVIAAAQFACSAASTQIPVNSAIGPLDEPVKSGERLYLNCAGDLGNVTGLVVSCFITIA